MASEAEDDSPSARIHPKGLVKRAARDCGTFTMDCSSAAGACQNACYHVNCVDTNKESSTMVYVHGSQDLCLFVPMIANADKATTPKTPIH